MTAADPVRIKARIQGVYRDAFLVALTRKGHVIVRLTHPPSMMGGNYTVLMREIRKSDLPAVCEALGLEPYESETGTRYRRVSR